jgi:dTDP-4-dehydrorhamnose 3,5-epimerase
MGSRMVLPCSVKLRCFTTMHAVLLPKDELFIRWDDPDISIEWPVKAPAISEKDAKGLRLCEISPERLFSLRANDNRALILCLLAAVGA